MPGIQPSPVVPGGVNWAEFPYTAHVMNLLGTQEGKKNDSTFFFYHFFQIKNCCPGVFPFFDMAEFNLDFKKKSFKTSLSLHYGQGYSIYFCFSLRKEDGNCLNRERKFYSPAPPPRPVLLKPFQSRMFVIRERCREHTAIFLAAF